MIYSSSFLLYKILKYTIFVAQVKEESAWKIAEMIVRDVTSLTLGSSDLPP